MSATGQSPRLLSAVSAGSNPAKGIIKKRIIAIDVSNISMKDASQLIDLIRAEMTAHKALYDVDPMFAEEIESTFDDTP